MFEQILKQVIDGAVQVLAVAVLSLGTMAINKVKEYFKSKLTDKQYDLMCKVAYDIYEYVEHEHGYKEGLVGGEKLKIAMQLFDEQMKKLNLPYTAEDFKLQVEKIIRQERVQG